MQDPNKFSGLQQFFLVALRVVIGWHLLHEGLTKIWALNWTSEGYLLNAQGPFASLFQSMAENPSLVAFTDQAVMWTLTIAGALLILGLFTRLSCAAGIALLFMFYISAPGWDPYGRAQAYTEGTYLLVTKNLIEMVALLAVAVFPTGQMAGLDILVRRFVTGKNSGETSKTTPPAQAQEA